MLLVDINDPACYAATILSDLRQPDAPHVVCVAKSRFIFCAEAKGWVWSDTPPDFQEIDCWETVPTRQVTDLVPEKNQAELLLWGKIRSGAQIFVQEAVGIRTVVKTRNLSPEPALYWQGDWRSRPRGKSALQDFMVAPVYARLEQPWEHIDALQFQDLFSDPVVAADTVFQTNGFEALGTLVSEGSQSSVPFSCDSICVNTDEGHIDMVWRARIPWDLMGERVGVLCVDMRRRN